MCMQSIQHFTIELIVNSLHQTFHKCKQSKSRFVNNGFSGSGVQDLLHMHFHWQNQCPVGEYIIIKRCNESITEMLLKYHHTVDNFFLR